MSDLAGQRASSLTLHIPETGSGRADIVLTGGAVPAIGARLTLTASDLPFVGTVLRADNDAPDKPHVVLVGGIGWETPIVGTPPSYQNDSGVRRSTVLKDLAKRAKSSAMPSGEPIELPSGPDIVIGKAWSCPAAPPGNVLRVRDALSALYEQGFAPVWRVDPDGVTRFGARVGAAVTARATQLKRNAGVGFTSYGVDGVKAFLPGNIVEGVPIRKLVIAETAGSLSVQVWGDARLTLRSRVLRIVAEAFPALTYGYPRTYQVAGVGADGRLDLAPPTDAPHLAALPKVEPWTPYGITVTPVIGSLVIVGFRDALPSRPFVLGYAPTVPGHASARVGDLAARLAVFPGVPMVSPASVWVSESTGSPYAWSQIATCAITGPLTGDAGTPVTIAAGSAIVKVS